MLFQHGIARMQLDGAHVVSASCDEGEQADGVRVVMSEIHRSPPGFEPALTHRVWIEPSADAARDTSMAFSAAFVISASSWLRARRGDLSAPRLPVDATPGPRA